MNLYANRKRPLYEFFAIDGVSSLNFGIRISDNGELDKKARRDIVSQPIPGRNGELTMDNGRYENVDFNFQCWIAEGYPVNLDGFADFLNRSHGYHVIEDTYHPGEYILARCMAEIDPQTLSHNSGSFSVPFNRQPQRFLTRTRRHGHIYRQSAHKVLHNPTGMPALPRIEINPTNNNNTTQSTITLSLNGTLLITVTGVTSILTIDSEKRTITMNGADKIADATFHTETEADGFPVFGAGNTLIEWSGYAGNIYPGWWRL